MKLFGFALAAIQGLGVVGLLALLQSVVRAFSPEWSLPFSVWWGLIFCLPGLVFAWLARADRI